MRVRRADGARRQRLGRPFVGAEDFRAREFAGAVEARDAPPDRVARRRLRNVASAEGGMRPSRRREWLDSRCSGTARRRARSGSPLRWAGTRAAAARPRRPGRLACKRRIARRHARARRRASSATIASSSLRPSIVSIERPSVCPTAVRQAQTGSPSISTVQAPQSPASQPTLTPVRPHCSRRTWLRRSSGEPERRAGLPLRVNETPGARSSIRRRLPSRRSAQASIARLSNVKAASRR